MNANHGIPEQTLALLGRVLAQFPEVEQAILFGSRAKGTHHRGSDIDVALVGRGINGRTVGRIHTALDDHSFSLVILNERLDLDVAAHIRRVSIPLFQKHPAGVYT